MKIPEELKYSKTHEWIRDLGGGRAEIGLTDKAQSALGDLVFVNLPNVGDAVKCGESFADVESVKAVSDVFSPADAVVSETNETLIDNPALINESPYGAWLIRVEKVAKTEELMDAAAYAEFCEKEA